MNNPLLPRLRAAVLAILIAGLSVTSSVARQPNIVVILTDDQGYADISLNPHHPKEVSTPHMDALADDGVLFSQGYISGAVCSPTRAGLMLGRYQQRVGVYSAGDGGRGFDPEIPLFPSFLPEDYVSTAIGKWHLGLDDDYPALKWHAMNRGFDECYMFMGRGGHSYFDLKSSSTEKFAHPIYRNKERIDDEGYLTNHLTDEAVAFIDRNKTRPFFLYLAYNAVHAPAEAPQADIDAFKQRFPDISDERAILMAMLKHLDDGVGEVVAKLKNEGLFDDTLLFFLTDNGGARAMSADNTPLKGFKGSLAEGGIRTPFIVSWPARFSGKRTIDVPIISLDILPTALDAIGVESPSDPAFDGKSLLPLLSGQAERHHEVLFWSNDRDSDWAVRQDNWKLQNDTGTLALYDLATDPAEERNIADKNPGVVQALQKAYKDWSAQLPDPITDGEGRRKKRAAAPGESPSFQVLPGTRQLFLDDYGIDHIKNIERTLHQPVKKGAVIEPDQDWESTLQTRSAPIWDPAVERFKLWMITSSTLPGVAEMSYAESVDGLRWTKPALHQKALQGSLENNIVTVDPAREWGANAIENVVYDPDDPDPDRRFKGFANVYSREPITSPDGIHWTLLDVPPLPSQDESNLCYDPLTRTFIATLKTNGPYGRAHALWTSTDFEHWTDSGIVFHADEEDQARGQAHVAARLADPTLHHPAGMEAENCNVDVYNLGIARYEGLYLGFPALFHGSNGTGFHLIQLACSRDLKIWERLGDRATFIGPSADTAGNYDWTQLLPPSGPVVHDEKIWFYYTGIRYREPPEGASKIGAICLAVLRRDGFVSLDAGEDGGSLLTAPFTAPAGTLHVNVDAPQGSVGVEILDGSGALLATSAPVTGDRLRASVSWEDKDFVPPSDQKIQLRFTLRNASLYAYWFE